MSDVLVVGAGPTGLLLAGDLAQAGVSCTVLDRRSGSSNLTRAFAVHARTLEQLDARGIADDLITTGARLGSLRLLGRAAVDLSVLPSRYPFVLVTPQYETERRLHERAVAAGVEFVSGAEVHDVRQDEEGVQAVAQLTDGSSATWSARYLVGTDGVHSRVRAAIGQPFPGRSAVRSVVLADVRLAQEPADVLTVNAVGDAFAFLAPFGDGWYRVVAWDRHNQQPDTAPTSLAEVRSTVQRALGTDYGMHDARWLSRFHSDERQAPAYRVGRVLLAGDAAHVHSPAGGQGMNTGLQDAANLSWKLAAVCRGRSGAELLDTYQGERHPVGATVLRFSGGLLRVGMLHRWQLPVVRAVVAAATRRRSVNRRFAGLVSGIDIAYPRPAGAHPLTGRRAPDTAGTNGERLYEVLRTGSSVLVGPGPAVDGVVNLIAPGPTRLVRPDGYIAWAADHPEPGKIPIAP
jgi:2-polyprenyl-6-methoxyphenol hydroxylase-like FAD-dependent oxidoreductase